MLYDPKWEEQIVVKDEPWRQVMREAAKIIQQRGWVQGIMEDPKGRVCMMGAILKTRNIPSATGQAMVILDRGGGGSWFNDRPGRTKEEVIAKMLEIADS